ncbi:ferredoxin-1 [Asticcacaulis biprosthecium C19]|uniref:Ferredoxin-1 n=1 Tax=Asticcacaulis biprosthecium C19 TaxID=715226 RepID=F4QHA8_9CAUL|nr:ferredoxin family protein [Asticcacaulis biprosthecium]EGF92645.1 ferredoxin-1 [Asticcacaulis biprosthecium C19]
MMSTCTQAPGVITPVIDRNRCDGKADCVDVCPYNVFELGILPPEQRAGLKLMAQVKGTLNGWKQSFTVHAEACQACGLCVATCPEKAIRLTRA